MKILFSLLLLFLSLNSIAQTSFDVEAYDQNGVFFFASSQLKGNYTVQNLFDGDITTAWVEGHKYSGIKEHVLVSIDEYKTDFILVNGYTKSENSFRGNNRIKKLKVSLHVGYNIDGMVTELVTLFKMFPLKQDFEIILKDKMDQQSVSLPFDWNEANNYAQELLHLNFSDQSKVHLHYFIKIEIGSVYKGVKWDDTCISEIILNTKSNEYPIDIRVSNDERTVFVAGRNYEDTLISSNESIYQIVDWSKMRDWVILIEMSSSVGTGRVETNYLLLNTLNGKSITEYLSNFSTSSMYGFEFKDGETLLEYEDSGSDEIKYLNLDQLK